MNSNLSWPVRIEPTTWGEEKSLLGAKLDWHLLEERSQPALDEDGDWNTKSFHRMANGRRKFNAIRRIKVDNQVLDEDSTLKGAIVHYYEKLYREEYPVWPFLDGIFHNFVGIDDALDLERHFSQEEVWTAINNSVVLILPFLALLEYCYRGRYGFVADFHETYFLKKA